MTVIDTLASRFRALTSKQIEDSATVPIVRSPGLRRLYEVENLTQIDQISIGIGDEGSGDSLSFRPREKKVVALFDDEAARIRGMCRIFKISLFKRRPR